MFSRRKCHGLLDDRCSEAGFSRKKMFLKINRAALISGGLAAALFIQPMCLSASTCTRIEAAPAVIIVQSHLLDIFGRLPQRTLMLRIGASCLLIAACSGLALASTREKQRKNYDQSRIASSLSIAVRSGLLDAVEHTDVPVWSRWGNEDETDCEPRALVLSRYRVLGYSGELRERAVDAEDLPVRTIVRRDPLDIVTDRELLLGVPRTVLRTEKVPLPWIVNDTPSEDRFETGLDSEAYLDPGSLLPATGGLELQ
jgi:hypothetical protein